MVIDAHNINYLTRLMITLTNLRLIPIDDCMKTIMDVCNNIATQQPDEWKKL